jgi:hypothetical protein
MRGGSARGEDLGRRPFAPPVVRGVQGANVFGGGASDLVVESLAQNASEPRMMNELTVELVQRDFQQRGRRGEIALGEVNGGGALVGIEWEAWRSGIPRVEGQRCELFVVFSGPAWIHKRQVRVIGHIGKNSP